MQGKDELFREGKLVGSEIGEEEEYLEYKLDIISLETFKIYNATIEELRKSQSGHQIK
ncbi:MAG: hypothetical protein ACTSVO_02815 [Candidatus Heimdallarchaeaceae archaeon]